MKNLFKKLTGGMGEEDEFEKDVFDDDYYGNDIGDDYDDDSFDSEEEKQVKNNIGGQESVFKSFDEPAPAAKPSAKIAGEKVSIKLMKPLSHSDGTKIADKLLSGSIVVLDISALSREETIRLIDFLAGGIYVLGGEMIKTNRTTIVVAPNGVDIGGFGAEESEEEESEKEAPMTSYISNSGEDY